jgi:hypothetical protein
MVFLFLLPLQVHLCRCRRIREPIGNLAWARRRVIHQQRLSPIGTCVIFAVKRPMGLFLPAVYIKERAVVELLAVRRGDVKCDAVAAFEEYPVLDYQGGWMESPDHASGSPDIQFQGDRIGVAGVALQRREYLIGQPADGPSVLRNFNSVEATASLPLPRCNRMVTTICGYDVHPSLNVRVCFRI